MHGHFVTTAFQEILTNGASHCAFNIAAFLLGLSAAVFKALKLSNLDGDMSE
jgi:hypothetical protein